MLVGKRTLTLTLTLTPFQVRKIRGIFTIFVVAIHGEIHGAVRLLADGLDLQSYGCPVEAATGRVVRIAHVELERYGIHSTDCDVANVTYDGGNDAIPAANCRHPLVLFMIECI